MSCRRVARGSTPHSFADSISEWNSEWNSAVGTSWIGNGIAGALVSAYTSCDGRLVLSDYTCETKEPPCEPDPKTGECPSEPPKK